MKRVLVLATLVATITFLAGARAALAQYQNPPPPPPGYGGPPGPPPPPPPYGVDRRGLTLGFSLGGGAFVPADCDACESLGGLALELHIGGMIAPNMAIMFDGSGVSHPEGDSSLTHVIDTIALQFWINRWVWLKGGLGFGLLRYESPSFAAESELGFGGMVAAGFEVIQGPRYAVDVQIRGAAVKYEDSVDGPGGTLNNGSVMVGISWY